MITFLTAKWQNLIMANYEIEPNVLLPYLPKGVELDFYLGKTYVSLVGFLFKDTKIFKFPVPFFGTFEEVNLRFYVVRKQGDLEKRGVVFINETVPNQAVAMVANKLYKEHYVAVPTRRLWKYESSKKEITYSWQVNKRWNSISVEAGLDKHKIKTGSIEEFIFEHYFGYTKADEKTSIEYKINHPSWEINQVKNYAIDCDFAEFYGNDFKVLNFTKPQTVMLAEGSDISVDWKRYKF